MARSKLLALVVSVAAATAAAQSSPMPTDIPYAVLVKHAEITDPDGFNWSADGGVCLNDQARDLEKEALKEVRDQNADLQKKLKEKDAEIEANRISPEGWVGIAASVVGSVAAAVTAVVAATQKH